MTNQRKLISRNKREGQFNTVRGGSKRTGPTIGALYLDGKKIGLVKSISLDNETLDEPCSGLGTFSFSYGVAP